MHVRVRRWVVPMLAAGLILLLGASLAAAAKRKVPPVPGLPGATGGWPAEYAGEPNLGGQTLASAAYFVWFDQRGWHLRFRSPLVSVFSGSITTDGKFQNVSGATAAQNGVLTFLRPGVIGSASGFDFDTTGTTLTFNLNINRQAAPREQVFLGAKAAHPARVPFTVSRTSVVSATTTLGTKDPNWEKPRPCGGGCD
ncbi:MAG TPA: hypothetical protein VGK88_10020 [bacterium]